MFIATSGPAIDWPSADGAELEPVAGEGERAGAVAVAGVLRQRRQHVDADGERALRLRAGRPALRDLLEDVGELLAEEDRDDRRRGLVGTEAMIVGRRRHDRAQQAADTCARRGSPRRRTPGTARCRAACRPDRAGCPAVALPIDQLTCLPEPLTPANGFSCSRQAMPYFSATRLQRDHDAAADDRCARLAGLEHRRDFVLAGRDFVVARLDRDAELEQLALALEHEGEHALGNRAEVVVLELLALRRLRAEERAAGREQVGPREVEVAVDQEVFLLRRRRTRTRWPASSWPNSFRMRCACLLSACIERSSGVFLSSASPVHETNAVGNAERRAVGVLEDVGGAGDVPGRVAAGFERGADAAAREARGVGLALDQRLAGELGERAALAVGREEAVVLLGREAGERDRRRARSAWRPSRSPSPSSPRRRRRRSTGRASTRCRSCASSDLKTGLGSRSFITALLKTLTPKSLSAGTSEKDSGFEMGL